MTSASDHEGRSGASLRDEGSISRANGLVVSNKIDGWMGFGIHRILTIADDFQRKHEVRGDILEIGIHHGRLFFVMAAAAREDEALIAVDLFDHQGLNVDASGSGSKSTFLRYADELFPEYKGRLKIVEGDSMSVPVTSVRAKFQTEGVRIFSVDGGHTRLHAINDLLLAQEVVVGGGLVLLDDFFGPYWPGVTEGFFQYMASHNRRLAPFLIFQNKLFLTTYSEHQMMLDEYSTALEPYAGELFNIRRFTDLCGFNVLVCA